MAQRVVLRLTVAHGRKKAPSIEAIFSGANWHERECFDFFGVEFENHPSLKPLLLPDDLGITPLLKNQNRRSIYSLLPLEQAVPGA
jgi:NADH-quinone oxidoreductase subunit C